MNIQHKNYFHFIMPIIISVFYFMPTAVKADFFGSATVSAIAKIDAATAAIIAEEVVTDSGTYGNDIINTSNDFYDDGTDHIYVSVTGQDLANDIIVKHFEWNDGITDFSLINTYTDAGFEGDSRSIAVDPSTGNVYLSHLQFVNFAPDHYIIQLPSNLAAVSDSVSYDSGQDDTPRGIFFDTATNELLVVGDNPGGFVNLNYLTGFSLTGPYVETRGRIPYDAIASIAVLDNAEGSIEYQLFDGTSWVYHNGIAWVAQTGQGYPTETNTLAEINANIGAITTPGELAIRAFLISDGMQDPQLDSLTITYTPQAGGGGAPTPVNQTEQAQVYAQKFFPLRPIPITAYPVMKNQISSPYLLQLANAKGSQCMAFEFDTRINADVIESNDATLFTLWNQTGEIGNTGISAVPKTATFTMYVCGYEPNILVDQVRVSASTATGNSAQSSPFPASYSLPEIPGLLILQTEN